MGCRFGSFNLALDLATVPFGGGGIFGGDIFGRGLLSARDLSGGLMRPRSLLTRFVCALNGSFRFICKYGPICALCAWGKWTHILHVGSTRHTACTYACPHIMPLCGAPKSL